MKPAVEKKKIRVRLIKDRRYARVSISQITVINSRDREEGQFGENVRSIDAVGLLKPVQLNDKYLERTGKYELVCGEGRLLAYTRLGKTVIEAELVTKDRKEALLM